MSQCAYHAVVRTDREDRGVVDCEMTVISPDGDPDEIFFGLCERFGFDRVISFAPIEVSYESQASR